MLISPAIIASRVVTSVSHATRPTGSLARMASRIASEIVSEIAGTTRDAVDVAFDFDGRRLVAIDTAGVRKKKSLEHAIELFAHARSNESIRRAHICVHMFDVREKISQVDKALAAYCVEQHKPVILVGNKIDREDER